MDLPSVSARSGHDDGHRRTVVRSAVTASVVVLVILLTGCVPNLTSPARTTGAFTEKALTTAAVARSAVQTVRLAVHSSRRRAATAAYVDVTVSDAERSLAESAGVFAAVLPPNRRADRLRDELVGLLDRAIEAVAQSRIALRRDEPAALPALDRRLRAVARALDEFESSHG